MEQLVSPYIYPILKNKPPISFTDRVIHKVATVYNLSFEEMCKKTHSRKICEPRGIAMCLIKANGLSYSQAASKFGLDHATALHHTNKVINLIEIGDKKFLNKLEEIICTEFISLDELRENLLKLSGKNLQQRRSFLKIMGNKQSIRLT